MENTTAPIPSPSPLKDWSIGLILFGVLQILLGLLCALEVFVLIVLLILSSSVHNEQMPPMSTMMLLPGLVVYAGACGWFFTMGIGSIRARRWARALILVTSWLWLVMGITGLIGMLLVMPPMYDKMAETGQMPQEMVFFMKLAMGIMMSLLFIVIPGALVLFYQNKNTKATCEFKNPQPRWTDKCPLPVLAISVFFGSYAVLIALSAMCGIPFPLFGQIATGWLSAIALLLCAVVFGYASRATYQLKMSGWWCVVLSMLLLAVSAAITFSRVSLTDFYRAMNMPQQQLDLVDQMQPMMKPMAWYYGIVYLVFFGYLVYIRKFFKKPAPNSMISL